MRYHEKIWENRSNAGEKNVGKSINIEEKETRSIDSLLLEHRRRRCRLRTSFSPVILQKIAFAT